MGGGHNITAVGKRLVLVALDVVAVVASVLTGYLLRFDGAIPERYWGSIPWVSLSIAAVRIALLARAGLYHRVWAYASLSELMAIVKATVVGSVIIVAANLAFRPFLVPRSVLAIEFIVSTGAIGAIRVLLRVRAWDAKRRANGKPGSPHPEEKRVLVIGAGDAGAMAVREIQASTPWTVVGLIDDDPGKHGQRLYGVQVLGGRDRIPQVVRALHVTEILIAIPSASRQVVRELVHLCRTTGVQVRILPALYELIDGRVTVNDIREVRIEDLLGREPVRVEDAAIAGYLRGRRVLVTGAGGSIGGELCRQVARYGPAELVLMGHGENTIFEMDQELGRTRPELKRRLVIGDIRDRHKVWRVFAEYRPEVVFHAAAHKHVPLMEANPDEAFTNNVLGTLHLIEAAIEFGAERFVLISTDKAVRPVSAMGASKRVAEMLVQAAANGIWARGALAHGGDGGVAVEQGRVQIGWQEAAATQDGGEPADEARPLTRLVAVRFGNVLGSRGSVVQVFKKQIAEGGPVTVTDPEMRRYFMTIPEAVQLVIQAGAMGQGGEVFVLDMGEPVRILDLARDMIRLSGFEPDVDIPIQVVGSRPGEKLSEALVGDDEVAERTEHPKILRVRCPAVDGTKLRRSLEALARAVQAGAPAQEVKALLVQAAGDKAAVESRVEPA